MIFEEMEQALRRRLEALPPGGSSRTPPRPTSPRFRPRGSDRRVLGAPRHSELRRVLIDLEEDKAARAVVFGLLKEMERK